MKKSFKLGWLPVVVCSVTGMTARATSIPFGVLSAYNVVALGTAVNGSITGGDISTSSDIGGRAAAAGELAASTTIGDALGTDTFGSQTTNAVVATKGLASGVTLNVDGGGNAYAPGTNGKINFNETGGGTRVTSGSSGVDFSTLTSTMVNESKYLGAQTATGTNLGTGQSGYNNPSFYVLKGTSTTLNIFTISAAVFADANHPLDIVTPAGSTTIINVAGTSLQLNTGIYYNGQMYSGTKTDTSDILFNFPDATSVAIDGQFSASLLAPLAALTGTGQMDGTLISASVACTGEIENVEFDGSIPWYSTGVTPEPSSLVLLGSGLMGLAGMVRRRKSMRA